MSIKPIVLERQSKEIESKRVKKGRGGIQIYNTGIQSRRRNINKIQGRKGKESRLQEKGRKIKINRIFILKSFTRTHTYIHIPTKKWTYNYNNNNNNNQ